MEPRKHKRLLIALIAGVFAFGIWFFLLRNTEPKYEGRNLSEWIKIYGSSGPLTDRQQAAFAIQAIGTNALPYLLEWINYEPSNLRLGIWSRFGGRLQGIPFVHQILYGNMERAYATQNAFEVLGTLAAPAIPILSDQARKTDRVYSRGGALVSLIYIGPDSIPALTNLATSATLAWVILNSGTLGRFGTNAVQFIPVLIEKLKNPVGDGARISAETLGQLKLDPERVVPALIDATASADPGLRLLAVKALGNYGAKATNALPTLRALRGDPDPGITSFIIQAIEKIAHNSPE
ncbi:hypothetical protein GC207_12120 [bacterium]|nr:hypothetical protein [bacterium]